MFKNTIIGIAIGLAFAFAIINGGFPGFLWALLFAAIGGLIGAHFDNRIDLGALFNSSGRGR